MDRPLDLAEQLQRRTKKFALSVLGLFRTLPKTDEARIIGRQVLRSATSVGANYRAACRSRSAKEFISRLSVVVEESDETAYWFELLIEGKIMPRQELLPVIGEADELLRIFSASLRTAKARAKRRND